jgi:hypothetical protein
MKIVAGSEPRGSSPKGCDQAVPKPPQSFDPSHRAAGATGVALLVPRGAVVSTAAPMTLWDISINDNHRACFF